MIIVVVDIYQTRDPFGLLDSDDADLGAIAGTVFDARTGQLAPDLDDLLEPLGDWILILNSIRLTPEWRGFGLGVLLAGTAIKKLSGGARAAVCYPAPIDEPADGEPDSPAAREQAIEALGRACAQLGFEHFKDGVHVLDLSLVTLDESLGRLHKGAEEHHGPG
jgi:GNAT superfamily N-acetyltransferase